MDVIQTTQGAQVSKDEYIVKCLAAAHKTVYKEAPIITWKGSMADTAELIRHHIPAVQYGPQGRSQWGGSCYYPREGEHANLNDLYKGAKVFIHTAFNVCSKGRDEFLATRRP